jgi:hypothetical protein
MNAKKTPLDWLISSRRPRVYSGLGASSTGQGAGGRVWCQEIRDEIAPVAYRTSAIFPKSGFLLSSQYRQSGIEAASMLSIFGYARAH